MDYYVLTLFPDMIENGMNTSIIGRARERGIISLTTIDIRAHSLHKHHRVDDYPYGGGAGMVMEPEPVFSACEHAKCLSGNPKTRIIYLTPQGEVFHQEMAKELAKEDSLIFLCGHYEGIDERVLELEATDYISIGDYVLTGGELPALVVMDSISRLLPGTLNNDISKEFESHQEQLLEYPQFTRPEIFRGFRVPYLLQSGHHAKIEAWRREESLKRTLKNRPDLLEKVVLSKKDQKFLSMHKKKEMEVNEMKNLLLRRFEELYGKNGEIRTYFAPGRVNLIGEHTDYNGGHVFPCALTIGTYAAVRKREDRLFRFYSMNFEELGVITASLDHLVYEKENAWTNYPLSVIWALKEQGYVIDQGIDILLYGTIPNSSGLSSSASVEVLIGYIAKDLFGFDYDMIQNALIGQYAENKFIGVNCGIMDQFAIAMGQKDTAIFLDTADLSYEYAPIHLKDAKIVILNTNKKRGLGDSKYNERRSECERALADLQKVKKIKTLGELSETDFENYKEAIQCETCRKRAKHAVYENQRTIRAVKALKENQLKLFGELMIASHNSLRDDYEVSGRELDVLVEEALNQEGTIGARMTGAGFGGCAVSIVKSSAVDTFIEVVGSRYLEKIGYCADFYVVEIGDGPRKL